MALAISVKLIFFLLMGEDDDQDSLMIQGEETTVEELDSSLSIFPEVSMHALAGQLSPKTIRVRGRIGNQCVQILIDNGNTHNFIQERIVHQLGLPVTPSKQFKVYIGNGDFLFVIAAMWRSIYIFKGIRFP